MEGHSADRHAAFGEIMFRRAIGELPEMECARAVAEWIAERYRPGMRILDVGCGAGHYLRSLRGRVDQGIDYLGVDASADYLRLARAAHGPGSRFAIADVRHLPFADRAFDIVFAANLIPNLPPPPGPALRELVRVTAGHLLIRTLFAPANYLIREFGDADPEEGAEAAIAPYNNLYAERYLVGALLAADPDLEVEVRPDEDWHRLDAESTDLPAWRTRIVDGRQVAGPLLLDWRFVSVTRRGASAPSARSGSAAGGADPRRRRRSDRP